MYIITTIVNITTTRTMIIIINTANKPKLSSDFDEVDVLFADVPFPCRSKTIILLSLTKQLYVILETLPLTCMKYKA